VGAFFQNATGVAKAPIETSGGRGERIAAAAGRVRPKSSDTFSPSRSRTESLQVLAELDFAKLAPACGGPRATNPRRRCPRCSGRPLARSGVSASCCLISRRNDRAENTSDSEPRVPLVCCARVSQGQINASRAGPRQRTPRKWKSGNVSNSTTDAVRCRPQVDGISTQAGHDSRGSRECPSAVLRKVRRARGVRHPSLFFVEWASGGAAACRHQSHFNGPAAAVDHVGVIRDRARLLKSGPGNSDDSPPNRSGHRLVEHRRTTGVPAHAPVLKEYWVTAGSRGERPRGRPAGSG